MLDWVDSLSEFITPEESDSVKGFIRGIPDRNTFLHGDFNSKNIMVTQKDGCPDAEGSVSPDYDFQLIDIGDAAIGHPVFDLAMLMNVYINVPADMGGGLTEEGVRHLLGFDIKYARQLWDVMCAAYFGLSDPADIDKMTEKLYAYSRLLTTFHATTMAGNRDALQARVDRLLRGNLLPAIDRAQPLDF
jgi:thiamine kinase-like enzyme